MVMVAPALDLDLATVPVPHRIMPARRSERIAARGGANGSPRNESNTLRRGSNSRAQSGRPRGGRAAPRGRRPAARFSNPIMREIQRERVEAVAALAASPDSEENEGTAEEEVRSRPHFVSVFLTTHAMGTPDRQATGPSVAVSPSRGPRSVSTAVATPSNRPVRDTASQVPQMHLPTAADNVPIASTSEFRWLQRNSRVLRLFRIESGIPTQGDHLTMTRLRREILDFSSDETEGCKVELVGDNMFHWVATIPGPSETVYEGGRFRVEIVFPGNYPFHPPYLAFLTKTYHCNIAVSGRICLDILSSKWSPVLSMSKVLISIMSLLADPNPNDPMDASVADVFKGNRALHDKNARDWTKKYAK
ncbi:GD13323 [Drosophila simulans]|uniref:E2 ubiquitin-conjugating enzyme n=2 Tax=Drosophila simulans TaxID=7240 RepID=B4QPK5_DROSI|nr:GD13323 [Drosophila simulans]